MAQEIVLIEGLEKMMLNLKNELLKRITYSVFTLKLTFDTESGAKFRRLNEMLERKHSEGIQYGKSEETGELEPGKFCWDNAFELSLSVTSGKQMESIEINYQPSQEIKWCLVPPNLTVPQEKSPLVTREGDTIELQCQVTGKPKPIILWSRADKEVAMPDGSMQMESYDGTLRIVNVSREMSGMYRCQTSQYNGFNVKPREALVQLIVQCK
ncbi:hypothetical protein P7K49_018014 [Saguinus oedipus]|uniref:Ig-like domain-containing protein n=1 Tax=Saguinus oedipus TaxID=9490 RepID=A0ABQ9V471_SAGOE|nr:hypothetical protein P7K49_018014 [Saguinus oedipus]